ncbi:F-box/kelch-repeat protein [Striga hermonthica]|uniref:F-box/kelch-repeat protein n=1 Tax=Striga hermonthica TaxID=68872 RepID=A0A9N7RGL5_STRHE|nr:F-box/kelch-repeat protein [Striga hermonthica]
MGLPSELHCEILLRLPASSLFRFRAVCKSWCHEIDDPSFIRAHTVHNHRTSTSNSILLLTSSSGAIYSIPVDSLNYVDGQRYLSVTRVPSALLPPGSNLRLAADSGNGLVLLIRHKEWVIWNPLTGDYLELAPTCLARTPFLGCGIGYDPSSDDYKVVSILEEKKLVNQAHIYSLRSNSWKMIEEKCPSRLWTPSAPTVLNGALYWVTDEMGELVALDLATEKFRKLPLPYCRRSYIVRSKVLGGRLVVFQEEDSCTAWVLKDYAALKPEWVRLITPMGLSLIKEETQFAISRERMILLWDVKNHSEKLIWIEEQVNFSQHMDTLIVAGENIFRFGVKRNWSEADDKRSEKIEVLFSEKELRPFVCTCGGHQMTD